MADYLFDRYRPDPAWYRHNPYGIHGLAHAARVLVWAEQVGRALAQGGQIVDMEAVRWAAAVHDVGRVNDGGDRQHGERSATWVRASHDLLGVDLAPEQVERVAYLCTWHVPDDRSAPDMTLELTCLKDADGLDRVRIHDLDARRLRTPHARSLPGLAQHLYDRTGYRPPDPWAAVREAALQMGLWL